MKNDYYSINEIARDIYRFTSLENVFFDLIVGSEKALLIDTGYGFGDIKGMIRSITDKPLIIANTHGHVDHTCGNYQFEEDIYISELDIDLLRRHNTPQFRAKSVRLQEKVLDWMTGQEAYGLPADFDAEGYINADTSGHYWPLAEGTVFDLGGKTIHAIAVPGHTKGSMAFLYEEENWLYVGDAANPFLWLFDDDATDRETLIRTYDKILNLNPVRIYGGHAPEPFSLLDVQQFKRAAIEADYEHGIPFETEILPAERDVRICILDGKTLEDIGKPGFYAIVLDESRK